MLEVVKNIQSKDTNDILNLIQLDVLEYVYLYHFFVYLKDILPAVTYS